MGYNMDLNIPFIVIQIMLIVLFLTIHNYFKSVIRTLEQVWAFTSDIYDLNKKLDRLTDKVSLLTEFVMEGK